MTASQPPRLPDPSMAVPQARICKKLVLKGQANGQGASYTLYLKAEVPPHNKTQTYALLPDAGVRLKDAVVHQLDAAGAAPALSESAASAAAQLGIPLSVHTQLESPPLPPRDGRSTPNGRRRSVGSSRRPSDMFAAAPVAHVSVSNFAINLITPPLATPTSPTSETAPARGLTPKKQRKETCGFIVILSLEVGLSSSPPRDPYTLCLPKPYCLNNYLKFAIEAPPDLTSEEIAVEIDPLILPRSRSQRRALSRPRLAEVADDDDDDAVTLGPNSDDSEEEGEDEDEAMTSVQGPFESCEALVVRWNAPHAGSFQSAASSSPTYLSAMRADAVESTLAYHPRSVQEDGTVQLHFVASARLSRAFYPGLDAIANLPVDIDMFGQHGSCDVTQVETSEGYVSWTRCSEAEQATDSAGSSPSVAQNDQLQARRGSAVRREKSTESLDDDDLFNVAPPSGLSDANIDFSFDSASAPTRSKSRRHSLVARGPSRPATPQLEAECRREVEPESAAATRSGVDIQLNVAQVKQAHCSIDIKLHGTVTLRQSDDSALAASPDQGREVRVALPVLRFPTVSEHYAHVELNPGRDDPSSMVDATLRRSQWAGSDGRLKLEPQGPPQLPPPDHGFPSEAHVATLRAIDPNENKTESDPTNAAGEEEKPTIAAALQQPSSSIELPRIGHAEAVSLNGHTTDDYMSTTAWSREATYSVRPSAQDGAPSCMMTRLQLDWPSKKGTLLPRLMIETQAAGACSVVAFVNGREVPICNADDAELKTKDARDAWQLRLPSSLAASVDVVRADMLFRTPWDGEVPIKMQLPTIPWSVMSMIVDLHGDADRRAKLSVLPRVPGLGAAESGEGVQLSGLHVGSQASIDFEMILESKAASARVAEQTFRHEDATGFQPKASPSAIIGDVSHPSLTAIEKAETSKRAALTRRRDEHPRRSKTSPRSRTRIPSYAAAVMAALLSFFAWYSFHSLWPMYEDLNEKVGYLATAQNIDFYDGTYGLTPPFAPPDEAPWHRRLFEAMAGVRLQRGRYDDIDADFRKLEREVAERERKERERAEEVEELVKLRLQRQHGGSGGADRSPVSTTKHDSSASASSSAPLADVTAATTRTTWDPDEARRALNQRKLEREKWLREQEQKRAASATARDGGAREDRSLLLTTDTAMNGPLGMLVWLVTLPVRTAVDAVWLVGRFLFR